MMEIFCCSVRAEGRHFMKLHTFATTAKEYWEISQHIFSSFVSFPRFPGGNPNKYTSDNDLYESWTFLEVVLCLLASDCRSSKLGNNDFFLLVDMVIERGRAENNGLITFVWPDCVGVWHACAYARACVSFAECERVINCERSHFY